MDDGLGILFCLTCSSDVEPCDIRTHQAQDHLVVRIAVVEDEATVEGTK